MKAIENLLNKYVVAYSADDTSVICEGLLKQGSTANSAIELGGRMFRLDELERMNLYDDMTDIAMRCGDLRTVLKELYDAKMYDDFIECITLAEEGDAAVKVKFSKADRPDIWLWYANVLWERKHYYEAYEMGKRCSVRSQSDSDCVYRLYGSFKSPFSPGRRLWGCLNSGEEDVVRDAVVEIVDNMEHETIRYNVKLLILTVSYLIEQPGMIEGFHDFDAVMKKLTDTCDRIKTFKGEEVAKPLGRTIKKLIRCVKEPMCVELGPILPFVNRYHRGTLMELIANLKDDGESIPQKIPVIRDILKRENVYIPEDSDESLSKFEMFIHRLLVWIRDEIVAEAGDSSWMVGTGRKKNACTSLMELAGDYMSSSEFEAYALALREKIVDEGRKRDILYYLAIYHYKKEAWERSLGLYLDAYDGDPSEKRKEDTKRTIRGIVEMLEPDAVNKHIEKLLGVDAGFLSAIDVGDSDKYSLSSIIRALYVLSRARTDHSDKIIPYMERISPETVVALDGELIQKYTGVLLSLAIKGHTFGGMEEAMRMLDDSDKEAARKNILNALILVACDRKDIDSARAAAAELAKYGLSLYKVAETAIETLEGTLAKERQAVAEDGMIDDFFKSIDGLKLNEDRSAIVRRIRKFFDMNKSSQSLVQKWLKRLVEWLCETVEAQLRYPVMLNRSGNPVYKRDGVTPVNDKSRFLTLIEFYIDELGGEPLNIRYELINKIVSRLTNSLKKKYAEGCAGIYLLRGWEMVHRFNADEAQVCVNAAVDTFRKRYAGNNRVPDEAKKHPFENELSKLRSRIDELKELGRTPAEVLRRKYVERINATSLPLYVKFAMRDYLEENMPPKGGYTLADWENTEAAIKSSQANPSVSDISERVRLLFRKAVLCICLDMDKMQPGVNHKKEMEKSLSSTFYLLKLNSRNLPKDSCNYWALCNLIFDNGAAKAQYYLLYLYNANNRYKIGKGELKKVDSGIGDLLERSSGTPGRMPLVGALVDAAILNQVLREKVRLWLPDADSLVEERKRLLSLINYQQEDGSLAELVGRLREVYDTISQEPSRNSNDAQHLVSVRGLLREYEGMVNSHERLLDGDVDRLVSQTGRVVREIVSAPSVLSVEGFLMPLDRIKDALNGTKANQVPETDAGIEVKIADVTEVIDGRFNLYAEIHRLGSNQLNNIYIDVRRDRDDNRYFTSLKTDAVTTLKGGESKMYLFSFNLAPQSSGVTEIKFSFQVNYRLRGRYRKTEIFTRRVRLNWTDKPGGIANPYLGLSEKEDFVKLHAEMFKGRKALIDGFKSRYLGAGESVGFIYGQRRCGKTAFAAKLCESILEEDSDYLIAKFSFGPLENQNSFALSVYEAILSELQEQIVQKLFDENAGDEVIMDFYAGTPEIIFDDALSPAKTLALAIRKLKNYTEKFGAAFPEKIFLVLDEFTNVLTAIRINNAMKVIFDDWNVLFNIKDVKVQMILLGHNNAPALLNEPWAVELRRRLHDSENFVQLSVFEDNGIVDEARMLITEPLASQKVGIDEKAVMRLKRASGRSPYFLMSMMETAVNYLNGIGTRQLRDVDVLQIQDLWLERFSGGKFGALMDCSVIGNLSADERRRLCKKVLEMVAHNAIENRENNNYEAERRNITVDGYDDRLVGEMIDDLIVRGVLKKSGDDRVVINVDIFRLWLKKEYENNNK